MRVLFLHSNFPAQFKNLCRDFAARRMDVKFICQTHYGRSIEGVNKITIKYKGGYDQFLNSSNSELSRLYIRANNYRTAFKKLKAINWEPQLVISHCGWGCGLSLKEIFPNAKTISYLEWWFKPDSDLMKISDTNARLHFSKKLREDLWKRNIPSAFEMLLADKIVAPTIWQKEQLPENLKKRCQVIYDGIDNKLFKYDQTFRSNQPKITYGTRGMEPVRCFPEFIESLPPLLAKWPNLIVEIAGKDEICYGGIIPKEGSWGKWAFEYLKKHGISGKVRWLGRLAFNQYINWLQSSWCHVYLTHPYIASWSLQESIFCKTPLVVNRSPAVTEFCDNLPFVTYTEDLEPKSICEAISVQLRNIDRWNNHQNSEEVNKFLSKLQIDHSTEEWHRVTNQLVA